MNRMQPNWEEGKRQMQAQLVLRNSEAYCAEWADHPHTAQYAASRYCALALWEGIPTWKFAIRLP